MKRWIVMGMGIALCFSASAVERYVDLNNPAPVAPYTNWLTAATDIQTAVNAASNGDVIWVTNGVYKLTNQVSVSKSVAIQSVNGPVVTTVDAQKYSRCFNLTDPSCSLSGFTITNGYAVGNGGGVSCSSSATVTNCVVSGNNATGLGGGAYCGTLFNCVLAGNTAASGGGGFSNNLTLCVISNNTAGSGGGTLSSTLIRCRVVGNSASSYGGGLYQGSAENCLIINNRTTVDDSNYSGGGGAYNATVRNCTICDNLSYRYGGGLFEGTAYNSIIYSNSGMGSYDNIYPLNAYGSCAPELSAPNGNITNAPVFINRAGGNYKQMSTSPCVNAGVNAYATALTDLDGMPRILSGTVDIGAYEYFGTAPVIALSKTSFSISTPLGTSSYVTNFTVRNIGVSNLVYQISTNASWLSVSPSSGSSTGELDTITVTMDMSALSAGSYAGQIAIISGDAANSPAPISVSLNIVAASIQVSANSLVVQIPLGGALTNQAFTVRNSGNTGAMNYTVSDNAGWLSVSPSSGTSTGELDTITISYDTAALAAGSYTGVIQIVSAEAGNSPQTVQVSLTVKPHSILLSSSSFNVQAPYGGSPVNQSFTVRNNGSTGAMNYDISDDAGWLSVSPSSGTSTGELDTITISYDTVALSSGTYTGIITVAAADATNSPKVCTVTLQVIPPSILLNTAVISVAGVSGTNPVSQSFTVRNNGNSGVLNYSISSDVSWLSANPASGLCSNETDTISLELNTTLLGPGSYTGTVSVTSAAANNSPQSIQVQLNNKASVIYVSATGADSSSGFSWNAAKATIQAGVNALTVTNGTVMVSNGVYEITSEILINKALTLRSVNGPAVTTIDAQWYSRCLNLGNYAATVDGFTMQNGFASESSPYGGAVYCTGTTPLLTNCVISDNIALNRGGGVYYGSLIGCVVRYNSTLYSDGGGLYQSTVYGCIVEDNTASTNAGGGLYAGTASNSVFRGNSAYQGGGIYNGRASSCLFESNSASYRGGGLYGGIVNNCTIVGGSAGSVGGGMYFGEARNSIIYYNTPDNLSSVSNVLYSCSPALSQGVLGNITNVPAFVNSGSGNYRVGASSSCINAGMNAYALGTVDLDGNPRISNSRVDMGAFEYQGTLPDSDNDGLDNVAEARYGSNPNNPDTDGDGFKDGWEVEHGWSPVSNDSSVRAYIENNPSVFGYYTEGTVGDLAMGEMMVKVLGTNINVRLQMMKSSDLITWTNAEQSVDWTIPATGKEFFRVRAQP